MTKLTWEDRMTIKSLTGRQCSNRHIARLLGVSEGTVRYHRRRQAADTEDGRSGQQPVAARFHAAIDAYVSAGGEESPSNVAALQAWLVAEHDYPAGLRWVQRYVRWAYPAPARRARRRVETPPGVQAQADWASFPGVWVGGTRRDLLALLLTLSFVSRAWALVWSERQHLLAWLSVHNAALERQAMGRVANSTASRPRHGPRCRITSVLHSPIIDSARALSYESARDDKARTEDTRRADGDRRRDAARDAEGGAAGCKAARPQPHHRAKRLSRYPRLTFFRSPPRPA